MTSDPPIGSAGTKASPGWPRWVPRVGSVSAAVTTVCCLGLPAAVSVASALGATFLLEDATLRPLLIAALVVTLIGSAVTFRLHRNPLPVILTAISGAWIYFFTFIHWIPPLVWAGLAVLIGAQVLDYRRTRACARDASAVAGESR